MQVARALSIAGLLLSGACEPGGPSQPDDCVRAPSGLTAWYRFDETSGTAAADFANTGAPASLALHGGAARTQRRVAGALQLDGDSAYAAGVAGKNVGTGDFSIALWVRANETSWDINSILDKRDSNPIRGYHLALYGDEPLLQLADAGPSGGWNNYHSAFTWPSDGNWHHLVVTVQRSSESGIRWYLDGVPQGVQGNATYRPGDLSSTSPLYVGRRSVSESGFFRGAVDELQIVNRALTPAEVSALHAQPTCR